LEVVQLLGSSYKHIQDSPQPSGYNSKAEDTLDIDNLQDKDEDNTTVDLTLRVLQSLL
jgi:hypothetical protein